MLTIRRRYSAPEALIGLGLLAFAGLVLWQVLQIPTSPIYAQVGPKLIPFAVAGGIAVLALLLLAAAARGGWQDEEEKRIPADWAALAWVAAGLVLNVLLIGTLGFTVASVVMFVLVARGFGSRSIPRDAAIGAAVALTAYLGFAKALGVNIGAGLVERLFVS